VKTLARQLSKGLLTTILVACGSNVYQATEDSDPATSAATLLEQKRPSAAIKLLESALSKKEGHPPYLSLLSAAYAQRAGIEPLSVAQAMAAKNSSSSLAFALQSSTTSLIELFDVMPEATTDSVADIQKAVTILTSDLPRSDWLSGDSFKFAIYQTASMVMSLKILDTNHDGKLSTLELLGLSSSGSGGSLISQLSTAASVLGEDSGSSAATQVASILESQRSAIDAMEGATDDEKLKNYLAKASGSNSTSTSTSTSSLVHDETE
jgi:hypothetical protein